MDTLLIIRQTGRQTGRQCMDGWTGTKKQFCVVIINYKNLIFRFKPEQFLVPQSKGRILGHKWIGDISPNILNSGRERSAC